MFTGFIQKMEISAKTRQQKSPQNQCSTGFYFFSLPLLDLNQRPSD